MITPEVARHVDRISFVTAMTEDDEGM